MREDPELDNSGDGVTYRLTDTQTQPFIVKDFVFRQIQDIHRVEPNDRTKKQTLAFLKLLLKDKNVVEELLLLLNFLINFN